jgi:hypothetical protein
MPLKVEKKDLSGLTVLITGANVGEYNLTIWSTLVRDHILLTDAMDRYWLRDR